MRVILSLLIFIMAFASAESQADKKSKRQKIICPLVLSGAGPEDIANIASFLEDKGRQRSNDVDGLSIRPWGNGDDISGFMEHGSDQEDNLF